MADLYIGSTTLTDITDFTGASGVRQQWGTEEVTFDGFTGDTVDVVAVLTGYKLGADTTSGTHEIEVSVDGGSNWTTLTGHSVRKHGSKSASDKNPIFNAAALTGQSVTGQVQVRAMGAHGSSPTETDDFLGGRLTALVVPSASPIQVVTQTLTDKTTWSAANVDEQWGTEEAVISGLSGSHHIIGIGCGVIVNFTTSAVVAVGLQISTDGGTNWTSGVESVYRDNAGGASTDRWPIGLQQLVTATPTGDVQVRAVAQATATTASHDLLQGHLVALAIPASSAVEVAYTTLTDTSNPDTAEIAWGTEVATVTNPGVQVDVWANVVGTRQDWQTTEYITVEAETSTDGGTNYTSHTPDVEVRHEGGAASSDNAGLWVQAFENDVTPSGDVKARVRMWASGTTNTADLRRGSLLLLSVPTAVGDATATPSVIATTVAAPAVSTTASAVATPAVTVALVALPGASATGGSVGTAEPAVIARAVSLPAATAVVQQDATATPGVIARSFTVPAVTNPTIVQPATIQVVATLPAALPAVEFETGFGDNVTTDFPAGAPTGDSLLPETAVQLIEDDGTHVAWLELGHGYGWRREKTGPGSGQVVVQRDDPVRTSLTFNRRLAFWLRGQWVHTAIIEPQTHRTVDQSEEAGQTVTVGGRGTLAVLDRILVEPLREDLQPVQDAIRFNFAHPDYPDSTWEHAVDVSGANPGVDGPNIPDGWLGPGLPIWGPSGTPTFAAGGKCYFRRTVTLPHYNSVQLHWVADNVGAAFFDGAKLEEFTADNASNYRRTHVVDIGEISAGPHTLAFRATNLAGDEPDPEDPLNPGYIRYALYVLNEDGTPGDLIISSGPATRVLEYPSPDPGWTPGRAFLWLVDHAVDNGYQDVHCGFNPVNDSDGNPWERFEELAVSIGDSLLDVLMQWAESYVDATMLANSDHLRMFNYAGRGSHINVDLVSGYDDPTEGSLLSLEHRVSPPVANRLLVRWGDNWFTRDTNDSPVIAKSISLQQFRTQAMAQQVADNLLDVLSVERTELRAEFQPRVEDHFPWVGAWHEADWVDLPNSAGTVEQHRVEAIEVTVDDDGLVHYALEAGDKILNAEERLQAWLARVSPGFVKGHTRQPMPRITEQDAPHRMAPTVVYAWDRDEDSAATVSHKWRVDRDGTLFEFVVELEAIQGADVTVGLELNGVEIATVTVPAGDVTATTRDIATRMTRYDDQLRSTCADTGFAFTSYARAHIPA